MIKVNENKKPSVKLIKHYIKDLSFENPQSINENNLEINSELMVAQYNSPWTLPPFRKNELLYKIK